MLQRRTFCKEDGRIWHSFDLKTLDSAANNNRSQTLESPLPSKSLSSPLRPLSLLRPKSWSPPLLRWNAMRGEFVAIAASRQDRPFLPPAEYCPLCPAKSDEFLTEIPQNSYRWATFENMFPGLSQPSQSLQTCQSPQISQEGSGYCEVVLFSQNHASTLAKESLAQIEGLFYVWQNRSAEIGSMPGIKHVFLFENKGAEVGVTLHHPHGQIYAFNHIPPVLSREQKESKKWFQKHKKCLVCTLNEKEIADKKRIVCETNSIVAYVPEAARYPYEVHISTKQHRSRIENLSQTECVEAATVLKTVLQKYDHLFHKPLPYLMVHHQCSTGAEFEDCYHWHIEIYPPHRSEHKLKFLAGVESGTGFFINDTFPEEKALELRNCEPTLRKEFIPPSYLYPTSVG